MKILIVSSKRFYDRIPLIQQKLEDMGHIIVLPNCYEDAGTEDRYRNLGTEDHAKFKAEMFRQSEDIISQMDAILVLNYKKDNLENYIGGATFLEMYDAFRLHKKIFLMNDIPEGIIRDETIGLSPMVIHENLELIR